MRLTASYLYEGLVAPDLNHALCHSNFSAQILKNNLQFALLIQPLTGLITFSNFIVHLQFDFCHFSDGKCQVCGEAAGRHCAYGGRVCPSCRAFFRRSVQTKYYEIFSCSKGERCNINLTTRKGCKFCRFKKCLQVISHFDRWSISHCVDGRFMSPLCHFFIRSNSNIFFSHSALLRELGSLC